MNISRYALFDNAKEFNDWLLMITALGRQLRPTAHKAINNIYANTARLLEKNTQEAGHGKYGYKRNGY